MTAKEKLQRREATLDQVLAVKDPARRRERLADFLRSVAADWDEDDVVAAARGALENQRLTLEGLEPEGDPVGWQRRITRSWISLADRVRDELWPHGLRPDATKPLDPDLVERAREVVKERNKWKAGAEEMKRERDHWRQQANTYAELVDAKASGDYWVWQADEAENRLESLVCPVLIPAANLREIVARRDALAEAIRTHRAQKADDRCVEDDDRLYEALGDGVKCDRRVGCQLEMAQNCLRFIKNRTEGGGWPPYAELEAKLERALNVCRLFDSLGLADGYEATTADLEALDLAKAETRGLLKGEQTSPPRPHVAVGPPGHEYAASAGPPFIDIGHGLVATVTPQRPGPTVGNTSGLDRVDFGDKPAPPAEGGPDARTG